MPDQLSKPPLVEALLEIKWKLNKIGPDAFEDPGFKWASGRLYDRVKTRFPHLQKLPTSFVPEEVTPQMVRHQYRAEKNGWPLVQLGPGIATVNITPPYTWTKFRDTIQFFIPHLVESYTDVVPDQPDYQIELESVLLRYINAVEWNWLENNTLEYLSANLHTRFDIPDSIKSAENIKGNPVNINLQVGYPISTPEGQGMIRFATGGVGQTNGIVWEILCLSMGSDTPSLMNVEAFMDWLNKAHDNIIERWFFELIKGELENSFRGG